MQQLCNKRILLGITGGIAAYKSAELVRLFKKANAEVRVIMTQGAMEFITPLTLQALSGNPVHHTLLDTEAEAGMGHIELAKWTDILVIAPASANFIARLTQGMGDDLLTTVCLATEAPICIAPAMNQAMWLDPATQRNIKQLKELRNDSLKIIGPDQGQQACGDTGPGRMMEPDLITNEVAKAFETGALAGISLVITAGPTREAIDPVRYISNHSSGKMGYAIAEAARDAGALVTLISGPVNIPPVKGIETRHVVSAEEMLKATLATTEQCQIFIATAAVADYRPAEIADQKIKKSDEEISIPLMKNPDILASVAASDTAPFCIGFAAETQNIEQYARDKMSRKKLSMIIANDVSRSDIGFNSNDNAVKVFMPRGKKEFGVMSKTNLARHLVKLIADEYNQEKNA